VIAAIVASLLLSTAADPCAPVEAAPSADPVAAAAYREIGAAEAEKGSRDTALLAYRRAAELDPGDRASRDALGRYCRDAPRADPFRDGMQRMDAGDLRGAIEAFRAARTRSDDPTIALMEGICHYELGEDRAAQPLLREAQRSPDDADVASLYLGLAALRAGEGARAAALFDAASASPGLAPFAADLARSARTDGRWALAIVADSGFDSNVNLAPLQGTPSRQGDGVYTLGATGLFRPRGSDGPYFRAQGLMNQQLHLDAYDVAGGDLAAGWQVVGGRWSGLAEYDFGYRTFGGSPFQAAHRLLASAWTNVGGVTVGASYLARFESYFSGFSPFSGTAQAAEVRASFGLGPRARLALAYGLTRDAAQLSILSFLEHGPRAELRVAMSRRVRLGLDLAGAIRAYDVFDPSLGARRSDTYLDAGALAEWDLSPGWTAHVALHGRDALSNVAGFEYGKLVPTIGVAYTLSP
jgi:tetratricopeptide (TPR) repeat protein